MNNTNVTIRIETRTIIRLLATITIFGLAVLAISRLTDVLTMFAISFFLAIALNPPVSFIAAFLPHHSRIVATAIAYIAVLAVLGTLIYVAAPPIITQTSSFVENFPAYIEDLSDKENSFSGVIQQYGLQDEIDRTIEQAQGEAGALAQGVGSTFVSGLTSFLSGAFTLVIILVLTFLMLIEGPSLVNKYWQLYTHKSKLERDKRVLTKMYKVVTGYVNGQVLVAAIGAASVFVVLFVLTRVFDEVPLGAIMPLTGVAFIAGLIPMFGATIAAVVIFVVLVLNSIPAAIVFLIFFLLYQQIENNVIQPVVQSRSVQLSAIAVFAAAIAGIALLGIVGAIMAIPIAGCMRVLLLDYIHHPKDYVGHTQRDKRVASIGDGAKDS